MAINAFHFLWTAWLFSFAQLPGSRDTIIVPIQEKPVEGIRIAWDYTTRQQLSPITARYAGYARMIVLRDGTLFCVYESEGATWTIQSKDKGITWGKPLAIALRENGIARAVPEVLQLQDNSILVSYNLRPHHANTDSTKHFSIEVKRSTDGGLHWSDAVEVYRAGHEFGNGCWEPAQVQLPSGEIQLYIANEGPYTKSNEQEITMFRSRDLGMSWTKGQTLSFRKGHRDGMPAPLTLHEGKEIIFAIEDNGIEPTEFKPSIIRTTNDWKNAPVLAGSQDREHALDIHNRVAGKKYAGAPYLRQLHSGEVILSYQSNEFRNDYQWDRSDMVVAIGSRDGRNFNRKSIPFYTTDSTKTALWNSLTVLDDQTVIALASTNAYSEHQGVWMIRGHILPEIHAKKNKITIDGETTESIWTQPFPVFIGSKGPAQARVHTSWDDKNLYVIAKITDDFVTKDSGEEGDGIIFFIDPKNLSTNVPATGMYSLNVSASGEMIFKEIEKGQWKTRKPEQPIASRVKQTSTGYQLEVSIPWSSVGGIPAPEKRIGFHVQWRNTTKTTTYSESLSGNLDDAPYTWSSLYLNKK